VGSVGTGTGAPDTYRDRDGTATVRSVPGPVTHFDVRSMYPFLMRQNAFPVKLISYREDLDVKAVGELLAAYGVVARVTISSQSAEYPYRVGERIAYPVGTFTTVLCGPELAAAVAAGEVRAVHAASTYKLDRPFAGFVDVLLSERYAARARGDWVAELCCKLVANSLAGKLAQRRGRWARASSEDEPGVWGESFRINYQTGVIVKHRHVAGIAWRWTDDETGRGPHTAAFAYLASYGRAWMRRVRETLPARSVVSQDTDGVWTLPAGTAVLEAAPQLVGEAPGQLSKKGTGSNCRWFGPRHYCVDGSWVLSGFHKFRVDEAGFTVTERVDTTLWTSRTTRAPAQTVHYDRVKNLPVDIGLGSVAPDGWVSAPRSDRL
jgi:hypothetical protein